MDSPLVDTSRLELNSASLLADMKDLLAQIKPMWPGIVKAHDKLANGEGDEDSGYEPELINFTERVLSLFAITQFAAVLIDAYDHEIPAELDYDQALESATAVVNKRLSDREFINAIRRSAPEESPPMGDSGIEYGAWIAGALAPSEKAPGRVFETMLLLLNGATDLHFGLGDTWRNLINEGFDEGANRLIRDVRKTAFKMGAANESGDWQRGNDILYAEFLKIHGRWPFYFEWRIDRLEDEWGEGYAEGYESSQVYRYVVEMRSGGTTTREYDTFTEALEHIARLNNWNANRLFTDGWYESDTNTSLMYVYPNRAELRNVGQQDTTPRVVRYSLQTDEE